MLQKFRLSQADLLTFNKSWKKMVGWGVALTIIGILAISLSTLTTLISVILLGTAIALGGAFITIDSFASWWKKWVGFFTHLIMGILYFIIGITLVINPLIGSMTITFMLGIFYVALGVYRIFYSISLKFLNWGWSLLSGVVTLLLGILILAGWPSTSLFIIGLFIGIDLVFYGVAYIMAGLKARNILTTP